MAKLTVRKKEKFCKILEATGNITKAALSIDLARNSLYAAKARCEPFSKMWDNAFDAFIDRLEEEGFNRAFGAEEQKLFTEKGKEVLIKSKHSDTLLIFMLKGNREKYRDRHVLETDPDKPLVVELKFVLPGDNDNSKNNTT